MSTTATTAASTVVGTVELPLTVERTPPRAVAPLRNVAVDAYRGFVMLLMMAEVLRFSLVGANPSPEIGSGVS